MRYAPVVLPLSLVGSRGPDIVIMGIVIGRDNRLMAYHQGHPMLSHAQVSGGTGGGKSSPLCCIAVHRIHLGHQIIMLEPGGLGENEWAQGVASRVSTLAGAGAAYRWVRIELERRSALMSERGAKDYRQVGLDPIVILGDEFPSLAGAEAISCAAEAEIVDDLITDVVVVARRGRKYGIHQVIVTQRPTIEDTFLRAGGVIQTNTPARIHLGDRDAVALAAAFRGSSGVKRSTLRALEAAELPGRALYTRLDPRDGKAVMAGQLWWIQPEQAALFARRYEGPEPIDFDSMALQEVYVP
jgi:hypothetical protein